jgi:hypothetical protein
VEECTRGLGGGPTPFTSSAADAGEKKVAMEGSGSVSTCFETCSVPTAEDSKVVEAYNVSCCAAFFSHTPTRGSQHPTYILHPRTSHIYPGFLAHHSASGRIAETAFQAPTANATLGLPPRKKTSWAMRSSASSTAWTCLSSRRSLAVPAWRIWSSALRPPRAHRPRDASRTTSPLTSAQKTIAQYAPRSWMKTPPRT